MARTKVLVGGNIEDIILPKENHPHEVPENWEYFFFTGLIDVQGGTQPPKSQFCAEPKEGCVRLIQIRDFSTDEYKVYIPKKGNLRYISEDDIMIARYGASLGRICRGLSGACNVALAKTIFDKSILDSNYVYHLLQSEHLQRPLKSISRTAQAGFNKGDLAQFKLPLPPFNEQKRIVAKVESLLSKINEAKQLIEEARETFAQRRSAILAKAFRGELTLKWREENPNVEPAEVLFERIYSSCSRVREQGGTNKKGAELVPPYELPNGWKWVRLRDVAAFKSGYAFKSCDFVAAGFQLIRMGNLYNGELDLTRNPVYIPVNYDNELIKKYAVNNGDILLTLTGTKYKRDYGYAVRICAQLNTLLLNQRVLSLTPRVLSTYIYYYLNSETFRDMFFRFETGAVNQGNVSSKAVENILFPLPPLEEGQQVQKQIDNMLSMEAEAFGLLEYETTLNVLERTVLAKAFRGELGTNDPTEESAVKLLKEVIQ